MSDRDEHADKTPPGGVPIPFSGVRLNLLEMATATNSLVNSLHTASRQIDRATGPARRGLCASLADQLYAIGRDLLEAAQALREEAEVGAAESGK